MEQDIIKEVYEKLPKISIDYGIMEKCNQVLVIPAFFAWDDVELGGFGTLPAG